MATNVFNSENSGDLPREYDPNQTVYELNRLHKRIDDILSKGVLTLSRRSVFSIVANFFFDDCLLEVDTSVNAVQVQLPPARELIPNRIYAIKDSGGLAGTRNITVRPAPGELIDGATSRVISTNFASFLFYSDGTRILVLS